MRGRRANICNIIFHKVAALHASDNSQQSFSRLRAISMQINKSRHVGHCRRAYICSRSRGCRRLFMHAACLDPSVGENRSGVASVMGLGTQTYILFNNRGDGRFGLTRARSTTALSAFDCHNVARQNWKARKSVPRLRLRFQQDASCLSVESICHFIIRQSIPHSVPPVKFSTSRATMFPMTGRLDDPLALGETWIPS